MEVRTLQRFLGIKCQNSLHKTSLPKPPSPQAAVPVAPELTFYLIHRTQSSFSSPCNEMSDCKGRWLSCYRMDQVCKSIYLSLWFQQAKVIAYLSHSLNPAFINNKAYILIFTFLTPLPFNWIPLWGKGWYLLALNCQKVNTNSVL